MAAMALLSAPSVRIGCSNPITLLALARDGGTAFWKRRCHTASSCALCVKSRNSGLLVKNEFRR